MVKKEQWIWALLRIALGLIFFWAFIDKVFGLGFATASDKSWLLGVSPTEGFLRFGTQGPFAAVYQSVAGSVVVDWLFMVGLLLIGLSLLLGVGMRVAGYSGALLMVLMWTAVLPPEHHPFLDEHIVYGIVLIGLTFVKAGHVFGFGKWWSKTKLVKKYRFLE